MQIKTGAKKIIEKLSGRKIYKRLPFGINPLDDLTSSYPKHEFKVIFDVGANIGQSAKPFSIRFPKSKIYCFEPISHTFESLKQNVKGSKNIELYQMAFGAKKCEMPMISMENSDMNSLKTDANLHVMASPDSKIEMIKVNTLSGFCDNHNVKHIDYLKIDTEGYDLDVIKGGKKMLDQAAIDFIEMEVGMNPNNKLHVPLEEVKPYMEINGYYLFGIYEQVQEWITQKPILRRSNLLFISGKMANK